MSKIKLDVPASVPGAIEVDEDDLPAEISLLAAIKLYELRKLSSGAAAELAGIARTQFLMKLGEYSVATFRLSTSDMEEEAEHA